MKSFVLWIVLLFVMGGCGYAPSSHYAKNIVGESVSSEVIVSMEDPQNTVIIKDAVNTAIVTKFRVAMVPLASSQTHLKVSINSVVFVPLSYDVNGYVSTYRTTVGLGIDRTKEEQKQHYAVSGTYDFTIAPNAIISDKARFDAIRIASQKALDVFIAQIAAQGEQVSR
jgi:hypothetical protein